MANVSQIQTLDLIELLQVGLWPVRSVEVLVPSKHGHIALGEMPEHSRALAFATEDLGPHRCVRPRLVEHTEPAQRRNEIVFKCADQPRIQLRVWAEQRRATEGVDLETNGSPQAQLLACDEVHGKTAAKPS